MGEVVKKPEDAPSRNLFIFLWAVLTAISFISDISNVSSWQGTIVISLLLSAAFVGVLYAGILTFIAWKIFGVKEKNEKTN